MDRNKRLYLLIIIFLGILVRAGFLVTPHIDSDQAIFGLQGRHILLGEFPIFSWGYAYMGTLQSYLDAFAFYVFGSNRLVLNSVTTFISIFFILVTYLLGKEIFGKTGGLLSAAFSAIGPGYLTIHGAWARHGYMETLLFGSLLLLVTLRFSKEKSPKDRGRLLILLGFIAGLGFWTNFMLIVYLPACGIYLLVKDRKIFRKEVLLTIPAFLLGSLPFWIYNLNHSFASLGLLGAGRKQLFIKNLTDAVLIGVPDMIGSDSVKTPTLYGFFVIFIGIFIFSMVLLIFYGTKDLIKREPAIHDSESAVKRIFRYNGIGIILLFLLSFFIVYSISSFGSAISGTRRYLLPIHSAIPIILSLFLLKIKNYSKPLMAGVAGLVLLINIYGNIKGYVFLDDFELKKYKAEKSMEMELFDFMRHKGIFHAYVFDYWLGPKLTFDAQEEIIFALPNDGERYPKYRDILDSSDNFSYVFKGLDSNGISAVDDKFRAMDIGYKREDVKDFSVFYSFSFPSYGVELSRDRWRAESFRGNEGVLNAFDGDVETAWFSGEPKRDGLWFKVNLGGIYRINGISLLPGLSPEGNMNGYSAEVSKDGRTWALVRNVERDVLPSMYWYNGGPRFDHPRIKIAFTPVEARYIKITHHGKDPYFNWTIAELFVSGTGRIEDNTYTNLIEEGKRLEAAGNHRAAMGKYVDAIKNNRDKEEGYYYLLSLMQEIGVPFGPFYKKAEAFEKAGLIEKAIENYEYEFEYQSISSDSSFSSVLLNHLSDLYGNIGDKEKSDFYRKKVSKEFLPSEKKSLNFSGKIEFLGYDIRYGDNPEITYYWNVMKDIKDNLSAFIHFVGPDGRVIFQNDHTLSPASRTNSNRVMGEMFKKRFRLEIPENLRHETYTIKIGVWYPKTGKRLKVREGLLKGKDEAMIGELRPIK